MQILKSLIIWLCFIPAAIINGGLREYVLDSVVGPRWALPLSGVILGTLIFLITWRLFPRVVKSRAVGTGWRIGLVWSLCTVVFECVAGIAAGSTFMQLVEAYNPLSGNLWLFVLAVTLLSPVVAAQRACRVSTQ